MELLETYTLKQSGLKSSMEFPGSFSPRVNLFFFLRVHAAWVNILMKTHGRIARNWWKHGYGLIRLEPMPLPRASMIMAAWCPPLWRDRARVEWSGFWSVFLEGVVHWPSMEAVLQPSQTLSSLCIDTRCVLEDMWIPEWIRAGFQVFRGRNSIAQVIRTCEDWMQRLLAKIIASIPARDDRRTDCRRNWGKVPLVDFFFYPPGGSVCCQRRFLRFLLTWSR